MVALIREQAHFPERKSENRIKIPNGSKVTEI